MQVKKTPSDYIGCITISRLPFYDIKTNTTKYKARPVLVIGIESNTFPCDFVILPISTITHNVYRHSKFDYELDQHICRTMNLKIYPSYIRVHKQSTSHSSNINQNIVYNLAIDQSDLYQIIKSLHQEFTESLF